MPDVSSVDESIEEFETLVVLSMEAGDPVLALMRRALPDSFWRPWIVAGVSFIVYFAIGLVLYCKLTGHLLTSEGILGGLGDPTAIYFTGVLVPAFWWLYAWMPQGIARTFSSLARKGAFGPHGVDNIRDAISPRRGTWARWLAFAALFISLGYAWRIGIPVNLELNAPTWLSESRPWNVMLYFLWSIPLALAAGPIIGRQISMIMWLRRLFEGVPIRVQPRHPDGSGGLGALGWYWLRIGLILVVLAIDLVVACFGPRAVGMPVRLTLETLTGVAIWAVGVSLLWGVLFHAHQGMCVARDRALEEVSVRLAEAYDTVNEHIARNETIPPSCVESVNELDRLYASIEAYPKWPVSFRVRIGIFSALTISVLSRVIWLYLQVYTGLPPTE